MTAVRDALPPAAARPGHGIEFTMAFQPIADLEARTVFAYEALVRGPGGEGAAAVFDLVTESARYHFDQRCRTKALALATRLGPPAGLCINFLPNALYHTETCLRATLQAARHYAVPPDRIIFELTEGEEVADLPVVAEAVRECQRQGLRIAIDDFGAGHSGLNLLADLQPDLIKLDMGLCRGIDASRPRRAIVHGVLAACADLGIGVIAEGVETEGELTALRDLGVRYVQGFLLARPAVESLPEVRWPAHH
ncbi:EAL domain-containing protein [Urbifossiella limnaea]|uniref:Blue light-and temperature-regulated antirepressor YcgF n=1 Tax=Urbifossiella limnaea TaxID=2528023 RepID=A0A517XM31_9BACT|nr:EAL domain-containing protein [Urbifossiella limnaea]QDU18565.1 Blue light- and temperature-regulated antirepressor YcgF [Urbifossiella limnaea]